MTDTSYERLAPFYDRTYSWKEYRQEAETVRRLIRRWGPRPAQTLLDVGCGTGAHLVYLCRSFACTGVDTSPAMLRVARRKLPSVRCVRASMPEFDLGRTFDAIVCLFSAIGYVRDERALRRTLRTFARHLAPGGIVIVEPWLTRRMWKPGTVHMLAVPSPTEPLARMNVSWTRGGRSVMVMHYLVGSKDRIQYWSERHEMSLFSDRTYLSAFRSAGLRVRRVRSGFRSDRGLYLGWRDMATPRTTPRPARRRRGGKSGHGGI